MRCNAFGCGHGREEKVRRARSDKQKALAFRALKVFCERETINPVSDSSFRARKMFSERETMNRFPGAKRPQENNINHPATCRDAP